MAHEVEAMYPQAVTTLDNGYKAVNYGLLPWTHTLCQCNNPKTLVV
jgi:hypothetical protein